ncbi:DarT ssDNA thymidine ADP-ribosyltransferase family protein [Pseudomonas sp. C11]|uniref:DarT ssDNA thymidine ADP-ribosyltransferase family protein n=1 Tax=Pseudomonas sp. C11 TaxID=3075550 RepID=UPI002AFE12D6|nr:DarT ssDNA thymidine ADP-ribosyltransferase family protein [Pseudomonas sp. C11]
MSQQIVQQRQINHLIHFTRFPNLQGILRDGIIPRQALVAQRVPFLFNDEHRWDGRTNASCLSISFPNYKMFWPIRLNNPNDDWAVLRIHPSILWEKQCLYCDGNAARGDIAATATHLLQGQNALEQMFGEKEDFPTRAQARLNNNEPTDVQAEVLVFGTIEPRYIIDINIDAANKTQNFNQILAFSREHPQFAWRHEPAYYYPRHDHWIVREFQDG